MHRGWFKQRIVLSGAWSVLFPSACVAGSLCAVCASCQGAVLYPGLLEREGMCLAAPRPRHLWRRLIQAASCPAVASGHAGEDGTL